MSDRRENELRRLPPRSSTDYPSALAAKVRALYREYIAGAGTGDTTGADAADAGFADRARAAGALRYYQFLALEFMMNPEYNVGTPLGGRGLLINHEKGMGKTLIAVAVASAVVADALAAGAKPPRIIFAVPSALKPGFGKTIRQYVELTAGAGAGEAELAARAAALRKRLAFTTLNAHNFAGQIARATAGVEGAGSLEGAVVIVDEAQNLFRSIINSADPRSNGNQFYEMGMRAKNVRFLFLSGGLPTKDPFELVPAFNLLAGTELLPGNYNDFHGLYVDRAGRRVRNRGLLANRILGLVSRVSRELPTAPTIRGATGADGESAAGSRAVPRELGGFPEVFPTRLVRVEMSPPQYTRYVTAREAEEQKAGPAGSGAGAGGKSGSTAAALVAGPARARAPPELSLPGSERGGGSTYFVESRQLSNFAPGPGYRGRDPAAAPEKFFAPKASPKFMAAVRVVAHHTGAAVREDEGGPVFSAEGTDVLSVETTPGVVVVYSQFVEHGLAPFARYLERFLGAAPFEPDPAVVAKHRLAAKERAKNRVSGGGAGSGAGSGAGAGAGAGADSDSDDVPILSDSDSDSDSEPLPPLTFSTVGIPGGRGDESDDGRSESADRGGESEGGAGSAGGGAGDRTPLAEGAAGAPARDGGEASGGAGGAPGPGAPGSDLEGVDPAGGRGEDLPELPVRPLAPPGLESGPEVGRDAGEPLEVQPLGGQAEPGPGLKERTGPIRYAFVTGDVRDEVRAAVVEASREPTNARGADLAVLLISKAGAEGLDLKYVRAVLKLEPYWDKALEAQVDARGIRVGSHDDLPEADRDLAPYLFISSPDPRAAASAAAARARGEVAFVEETSIDERLHLRALERGEINADFQKLLAEVSIECSANAYGSEAAGANEGLVCRMCVPNGAALYHPDPRRAAALADPCEPLAADSEVSAEGLAFTTAEGEVVNVAYVRGDDSAVSFYRYSPEFDAYTPVDPSDPLYEELVAAIAEE